VPMLTGKQVDLERLDAEYTEEEISAIYSDA
jgi:hypothetical protein